MMMKPLRREHLTAEGYKRPPEGSPTAGCIPPHPRHLSGESGEGIRTPPRRFSPEGLL